MLKILHLMMPYPGSGVNTNRDLIYGVTSADSQAN